MGTVYAVRVILSGEIDGKQIGIPASVEFPEEREARFFAGAALAQHGKWGYHLARRERSASGDRWTMARAGNPIREIVALQIDEWPEPDYEPPMWPEPGGPAGWA